MAPRPPYATLVLRLAALVVGLLTATAITVALPRPSDAQPETELSGNAVDVSMPRGFGHTPDPIATSDDEDRGTYVQPTRDDGLSKLPTATPYPTPSTATATDVESGIELLHGVPGVSAALAAVENRDAAALVALMETTTQDCALLGRSRPENCEQLPGTAVDGTFETVIFAIMGARPVGVVPSIDRALDAAPRLVFATRDATRRTDETVYYLVFETDTYDFMGLGGSIPGPLGGFALEVWAREDRPVGRFAPMGPGGSPLEFVQTQDAAHQELILPESLDGFDSLRQRD